MGLRNRDLVPGKKQRSRSGIILPIALALAVAVLLRIGIRTWFYEPVVVSEPSMAPRLSEGSVLYARKYFKPAELATGDLVWLEHPLNPSYKMIRAIAARPGDVVLVKGGRVFVNGAVVGTSDNPGAGQATSEDSPMDEAASRAASFFDQAPRTLPEGSFFVLASSSGLDSRHFGPVPASKLIGIVR